MKNKILKGSDMVAGDNIIMPIDMVRVAVIRSMTRKGSIIRKPISKPRRNSEIIKAGIKARRGVASVGAFAL